MNKAYEFYDLENDPYEVTNLIDSPSEEQLALRQELLETVARLGAKFDLEASSVDADTIARLRAMGYVQ